jgi:hypothetical protein
MLSWSAGLPLTAWLILAPASLLGASWVPSLPLLAPVIDLWPVIGAWLAFNLVQAGIATYAFRLDGESLRPLWVLPAQQLVYRQLMYLVVIQSIITALLGVHLPWQRVERTGALDQPRQATGS